MKLYVPRVKPVAVKAIRLRKALTANAGDYLVLSADGNPYVLPAQRFEELYVSGEKSKTRRVRKPGLRQQDIVFDTMLNAGKPLSSKELASLLPPDMQKQIGARIIDLVKEGKIVTHRNVKPWKYEVKA